MPSKTPSDTFTIRRLCLLLLIAGLSLGPLATPQAVLAASIVVDTTNDELNTDGDGSLREAIEAANTATITTVDRDSVIGAFEEGSTIREVGCTGDSGDVQGLKDALHAANAAAGPDTIILAPSCTYTLTEVDNYTYYGPNGLPAITSTITIQGQGSAIVRDPAASNFRFFYIGGAAYTGTYSIPATGTLTLENLTLVNGLAKGGDGGLYAGGGAAGLGGAIYNQGHLTLDGVTAKDNTAQGGSGQLSSSARGGGGGFDEPGGNNTSGDGGDGNGPGCLYNGHGGGGGNYGCTAAVYAQAGSGGFGGGGGGGGGGGSNGGRSGGDGGFGGGGGGASRGDWYPGGYRSGYGGFAGGDGSGRNSGGGAGMGGVIFNHSGEFTLLNSTLYNNMAVGGTGAEAGSGLGGAVFNLNGDVTVQHSTLASNTVSLGVDVSPDGGALYNLSSSDDGNPAPVATVTLVNSILANSTGGNDLVNNQVNGTATVDVSAPNLVESSSGALVGTPSLTGDPALDPLANNGGGTWTQIPQASSPVLDYVTSGSDGCGSTYTADQRGEPRPDNGACELGAYEVQANEPPVADNENYVISYATAFEVPAPGVMDNDFDPESQTITAALVDDVPTGTLDFHSDGAFIFTPTYGVTNVVAFTYRINDGVADSNVVRAVFDIINLPPTAADDTYTTTEDTPLTVSAPGVLNNDSDYESNPLTAVLDDASQVNGTLDFNSDGAFTYTPTLNSNGTFTFTYYANDGSQNSEKATVEITVDPVNDPPTASDDSYTTDEDTSLSVSAPGVLGNDSDVEGYPLIASLVDDSQVSGTLVLNADGSFDYTPALDANGTFTFSYQASDLPPIQVTTTDDELNSDGDCSLREAIQSANTDTAVDGCASGYGADTILLPAGMYQLTISGQWNDNNATGDLDIYTDLTLTGNAPDDTLIDGNDLDRVVHIRNGAQVTMTRLTVQNGNLVNDGNQGGGGLFIEGTGSSLYLADAVVRNNEAGTPPTGTGNSNGGGLQMFAGTTVEIERSLFTGNFTHSGRDGFAIYAVQGTLIVRNSTFSGNGKPSVNSRYGTIVHATGTTVLEHVTITDNEAEGNNSNNYGGGLQITSGAITMTHSIVAGNLEASLSDCVFNNTSYTSLGYNIVGQNGSANGCPTTGPNDQVLAGDITTLVDPLADNGGPSWTYALATGSPAIDYIPDGTNGCGTTITDDQRGAARPVNGGTALACDTGAYEYLGTPAALSPLQGSSNSSATSAPATVTLTVNAVNDAPVAADDTFAADFNSSDNPLDVLANDTDVDSSLTVGAVADPINGTATNNTTNILYTPDTDFFGTDVFTYTATDGGLDDSATITVTVDRPAFTCTASSGLWSDAAIWDCPGGPQPGDTVVIPDTISVTLDTDLSGALDIHVDAGGTLAAGGSYDLGGSTATVSGTFQLDPGGFVSNGTFDYTDGSSLAFNTGGGAFGLDAGHVFWPDDADGPDNLVVSGSGLNMNGIARTVDNATLTAGLEGSSSLTVNDTLTIEAGGWTSGVSYGASATLVYDTGGSYSVGGEWTGSSAPANVTIAAGSALDLTNASGSLSLSGDLTIDGTLDLSADAGETLTVGGDFTLGATGTFNANGQSVIFNGAVLQTITGDPTFADVTISTGTTVSGTLSGAITNDGTVAGGSLSTGSILTGGDISGDLANDGTLADVFVNPGVTITGGNLAGMVWGGTLVDVTVTDPLAWIIESTLVGNVNVVDGALLEDVIVDKSTTVTGGTYAGSINNNGIVADASVDSGALVSGGVVSGTLTNSGALEDVTVDASGIVNGGVVSGTVTSSGTLSGATLYTGSTVTGGTIAGTTDNDGTLIDTTIDAGATVDNTGGTVDGGTNNGTITGGTITGTVDNNGTLVDTTIAALALVDNTDGTVDGGTNNGSVTGGTVTGTVDNNGSLIETVIDAGATVDNTGGTVSGGTNNGSVTGGTLSGTVDNNGTLVDSSVDAGAIVTGGVISGTVTSGGILSSTHIYTGSTVTGGTIAGTTDNDGTLIDTTIDAGATVDNTGGTVDGGTNNGTITGGTITGTVDNNGTLVDTTIDAGATVDNTDGTVDGGTNNGTITGGTITGTVDNNGSLIGATIDASATVDNTGGTVSGGTNDGTVTGGTLSGDLTNNGTLADFSVDAGGIVTGGTISGTLTGSGTLSSTTVTTGTTVTGSTLGGLTTNYGELIDIDLVAGATVSGGTISGTITGDPANPATLSGVTVADGTHLSGVVVDASVTLPSDLTLGDGVVLSSGVVLSGYTVDGTVQNGGTLEDVTLQDSGVISGGTISGTIVMSPTAVVENVTVYSGTVVSGGVVSGTITNYGELADVSLTADTEITGGTVSGTISGTSGAPATLVDVTVAAGTTLEHVIVTDSVILPPDVVLGDGVVIQSGTTVSGGTIDGAVTNLGTLDGVTVTVGSSITGGTLSGTIANNGELSDVTVAGGATVTGGTLSGTTTNDGTLTDVSFGPQAEVSSGTLSGTLSGTSGDPALLTDLTVSDGSTLTHVIIGLGVTLGENVTLGEGVSYAYDVAVLKTAEPKQADPGDPVTYTLSFANTGSFTATNVVITDSVPAQVLNPGWSSSGVQPTERGGTPYVWDIAELVPGAGGIITITGTLADPLPSGSIINTATITATYDLYLDNNKDSAGVSLQNLAPVALDDSYATAEDTPLTVPADGVLGNDSDPNEDALTAVLDDAGQINGTLDLNGDGSFTYTPSLNVNGTFTFTYHANDGSLDSNSATVSITVSGDNDAPVADADSFTVAEDSTDNPLDVLEGDTDVDGDPLAISALGTPAHGTAINGTSIITYTPAADFTGTDTFTYTVSDGQGGFDSATVTVTVTNDNDAPVADDDSFTVVEDSADNALDVLDGDTDADSDPLYVSAVGTPAHGTAVNNTTDIGYTPAADFTGTDTFTYTVADGQGGFDSATVTVTVTNVPDAPVLSNVTLTSTIAEGNSATLSGDVYEADATDPLTLTVDWGDGSVPESFTYPAGTTHFSESHTYLDDDPSGTPSDDYTVAYTMEDVDGGDSGALGITVNNVAPQLQGVVATSLITENQVVTATGAILDPGTQDTFTLTLDWGDGSAPETFVYPAGTASFLETHRYLDDARPPADFDLTFTLTDDDTGSAGATATVRVNNAAPDLTDLYIPVVDEHESATLSGTIVEVGPQDSFTLTVNWGDGTLPEVFTYPAGTTAFSETHTYLDDDPSGTPADDYPVILTLEDDDGGVTIDPLTVTVTNVAPQIADLTALDVDEGAATLLSGAILDPGSRDTFTLTVNWGDSVTETFTYPAGTTLFSETHTYLDDNPSGTPADDYTLSVTLVDDDTGSAGDSTTLTVHNVAPQVDAGTDITVIVGTPVTFSGTYSDVGVLDTHTVEWDFGDGGTASGTLSPTHAYAVGVYTTTLTVTDDDGGVGSDSVVVTVERTQIYLPLVARN